MKMLLKMFWIFLFLCAASGLGDIVPPKILKMESTTTVEGKDAIIECFAEGVPKPVMTIRRYRSDEDIVDNPDDGIELEVFDDGDFTRLRLQITNVKRSDNGIYVCKASNTAGEAEKAGYLQVQFRPDMSRTLVTQVKASPDNPANLSCIAQAIPNATITWKFQGEPIESSDERFRIFGRHSYSRLLVDTAHKPDYGVFGTYTCEARNEIGENTIAITLDKAIHPKIFKMENLTTVEGKDAVIECLVEGFPKPVITIRRDNSNEDIINNLDDGIELEVFDDGDFTRLRLQITNVKRSDGGLYICKASNTLGVTEKAGHLQVQFRPDMSRTLVTRVKTWSDNPANLSCIAEAIPNAIITWKFQGEPIDSSDERFRISGEVSYSSLLVHTANRPDYEVFGTYTCEATNVLGKNSMVITLDKATRPSALTQIVFDIIKPTSITFRLMGPGNTGGMPITHYTLKYKLADQTDDAIKEVTWEKDTPYILTNLIPRAKYQFSAAAINVVGVGDYKEAIYIMPEETVPEPPTIIAKQETVSEYPDRFEVRWDEPNNNGAPIFYYIILYFKVERGKSEWIQTGSAVERGIDADELQFMMNGLMSDTYYKIELRATNKMGSSIPESVVIKTSIDFSRASLENPDLFGGDMMGINDPDERNAIPWEMFRWPNARVPYVIDTTLVQHKDKIQEAMDHYHETTCVKFVPRTNEPDYIRLFAGQGCYSHVGMTGGQQPVSLGRGCIFKGTIVHELGHALGFYHEQNRSDRDEYLNIFLNNVQKGMESNFVKLKPDQNILFTPFDSESIMIYGNYAFSKDGTSVTMRAKNGKKLQDPFKKQGMTESDITRVRMMYKCP